MKSPENPYGVAPLSANNTQINYVPVKNNGLAIASLILGILSLVFYIFCAIPGVITGHLALSRAKRFPDEYEGRGLAIAGLILSYIMLVLSLVFIIWMIYMFTSVPGFSNAFKGGFMDGLNHRE